MFNFQENYILDFLLSRGWSLEREGNLFYYLKPNEKLKFPPDFRIELPKISVSNQNSYDNYINRLIEELLIHLPSSESTDELKVLFSENRSIMKYRVFDHDNLDGSISFINYIESLDIFKKMLSQTVSFVTTDKQIYANSKAESELYLEQCRTLQTEKGSFITKIEVPNGEFYTAVSKIESSKINSKLFDVINFTQEHILQPKENIEISENYISDFSNLINYELLTSIKEIYSKTNFNNVEFELTNTLIEKIIHTEKVQKRIPYFNKYLREVKKILLETQSIEVVGFVKKLTSNSPKNSSTNEVILETVISNVKEKIKLVLKSEEYYEAIEAHKNEFPIAIKGKARQGKTMIYINEIEKFEVIVS